jgi:hypothetical protein
MRIRFEKLTASYMIQKCAMFYENRKFLIVVTIVISTFLSVRRVYKNTCPSVCLNMM